MTDGTSEWLRYADKNKKQNNLFYSQLEFFSEPTEDNLRKVYSNCEALTAFKELRKYAISQKEFFKRFEEDLDVTLPDMVDFLNHFDYKLEIFTEILTMLNGYEHGTEEFNSTKCIYLSEFGKYFDIFREELTEENLELIIQQEHLDDILF